MDDLHRRLIAQLETVAKAYRAERDSLYDSVTNSEGEYDHPDDKAAVEYMDAIIDSAFKLLEEIKKRPRGKQKQPGYIMAQALRQIANGEGTYGAQAHEYKQIARAALANAGVK